MKLLIDIPQITYDAIMTRDWKNSGCLFSPELKAIHDGKVIEQEPYYGDAISREKTLQIIQKWFDRNAAPSELKNEIEQLPSVQSTITVYGDVSANNISGWFYYNL